MDNQTHIHYHFDTQSAKPKPPKLPKLFVAVNNNAYSKLNTIKYSVDGNNWSNIISGGFDEYQGNSIAYGKNTWVATGASENSNNSIQYSKNGYNWNSSISGGFNYNYGGEVVYGKNMWVSVGHSLDSNNSIQYSTTGSNWNSSISGGFIDNYYGGVVYGKNTWVAYGQSDNSNNSIQYSTDGSNWNSTISGGFYNHVYSIAYGKNMWIAIGSNDNGDCSTIKYSMNGSNWSNTSTNLENVGDYSKIIYGSNNWLLYNSDVNSMNLSSILKYSTNGSNWIPSYIGLIRKPTSISYTSMVINNKLSNRWIAYYRQLTQYSINGTRWYHDTDNIFSESVHN